MLLFSHYVAEIEDKRFYDYSPEFIADQKSEDYQNMVWRSTTSME
jgi:hypothetical protein